MSYCKTVFIQNLNYSSSEEDIKNYFSQAGEVEDVFLFMSKKKQSQGMAYVKYKAAENARNSIAMFHRKQFNEKTIDVSFIDLEEEMEKKDKKEKEDQHDSNAQLTSKSSFTDAITSFLPRSILNLVSPKKNNKATINNNGTNNQIANEQNNFLKLDVNVHNHVALVNFNGKAC